LYDEDLLLLTLWKYEAGILLADFVKKVEKASLSRALGR